MVSQETWRNIGTWLEDLTGQKVSLKSATPQSGGCINQAWLLDGLETGSRFFLKVNTADKLDLFEAEQKSLNLLAETGAIRIPLSYGCISLDGLAVHALEGLNLVASAGPGSPQRMGSALAQLHQHSSEGQLFGADFSNHIGETPQPNPWTPRWADFFLESRLRHQFDLVATRRGRRYPEEQYFLKQAHSFLIEYRSDVTSALLHGDLWSGNAAFLESGEPVFFDPASYFGDSETDIAFTKMFGGFPSQFYSTYRKLIPAPPHEDRLHGLYNLYHLLNHYYLFGGGYGEQAHRSITSFLSG